MGVSSRMTAFLAIIARDLRLGVRVGGEALTLVLFFVMVGVIAPFAIGPDSATLARLGPGLVWIAAFLSMLLGLDRLFRLDDEDGSLILFRHAALPFEAIVAAKVIAHWLLTAVPLIVASPLLAVLLGSGCLALVFRKRAPERLAAVGVYDETIASDVSRGAQRGIFR